MNKINASPQAMLIVRLAAAQAPLHWQLFAPGEPLPYAAGDRIRFVPIDEGEFERIQKREEAKRHGT